MTKKKRISKEINQSMWASFAAEDGIVHIDIKSIQAVSEYESNIVIHTTGRDFQIGVNKSNEKELERAMRFNQNYLVQV